ncbi:hypothetical protein FGB62_281g013 [Gracilaria domingensis]|nr:hypothetical protein FGB62_281g013 [Gracilaria domingensis]
MRQGFIVPLALSSNSHALGNTAKQSRHRRARRIPKKVQAARSDVLEQVSEAVRLWQIRTNTPPNWMPTSSIVRRCEVAKELHLNTLITKAGGYRQVQHQLNLQPPISAAQNYQEREVRKMAFLLRSACEANGFPPPEDHFPTRHQIRRMAPILANRIASFPGRRGYGKLAEYIKNNSSMLASQLSESNEPQRDMHAWGVWTSTDFILYKLKQYQSHSRIMPRLCSLPSSIACAVQRKGGAALFAREQNMLLEKDVDKMSRYASLVRWLDNMVAVDSPELQYIDMIRLQSENPPPFPSSREIHKWEMEANLARCGGRRYLALRLGFAPECAMKGLRMGPFSVRLAADLLEFALCEVLVSVDGNLAMPSISYLQEKGKLDLAIATQMFGGEDVVGRRIGLVPQITSCDDIESVIL